MGEYAEYELDAAFYRAEAFKWVTRRFRPRSARAAARQKIATVDDFDDLGPEEKRHGAP